jgi:hypothetical protein
MKRRTQRPIDWGISLAGELVVELSGFDADLTELMNPMRMRMRICPKLKPENVSIQRKQLRIT